MKASTLWKKRVAPSAFLTCKGRTNHGKACQAAGRRQWRTARTLIGKLENGPSGSGLLLADDVGTGKTRIALLVALAWARVGRSVMILAPNDLVAKAWLDEAGRLNKAGLHGRCVDVRKGKNPSKGSILVHTQRRLVGRSSLICDLLILDEAHRNKGKETYFKRTLDKLQAARGIKHILLLTATPMGIAVEDLLGLLRLCGAPKKPDIATVETFGGKLAAFWKEPVDDVAATAETLFNAKLQAGTTLKRWMLRHAVGSLPTSGGKVETIGDYGVVEDWPLHLDEDPRLVRIQINLDRALGLARRNGLWERRGHTRNDPRFHVGHATLKEQVAKLRKELRHPPSSADEVDVAILRGLLNDIYADLSGNQHPKAEAAAREIAQVVQKREKVLVFCHHHASAVEVASRIAAELERVGYPRSLAPNGQPIRPIMLTADCAGKNPGPLVEVVGGQAGHAGHYRNSSGFVPSEASYQL